MIILLILVLLILGYMGFCVYLRWKFMKYGWLDYISLSKIPMPKDAKGDECFMREMCKGDDELCQFYLSSRK